MQIGTVATWSPNHSPPATISTAVGRQELRPATDDKVPPVLRGALGSMVVIGTFLGLFPTADWRGFAGQRDLFGPRWTVSAIFSCLTLGVLSGDTVVWLWSELQAGSGVTTIAEIVTRIGNRLGAFATLLTFAAASGRQAAYVRRWGGVADLLERRRRRKRIRTGFGYTRTTWLGVATSATTVCFAVVQFGIVKMLFSRTNVGYTKREADVARGIQTAGLIYDFMFNHFAEFYCVLLCEVLRIGFEGVATRLTATMEHRGCGPTAWEQSDRLRHLRIQHQILCELVTETHRMLSPALLLVSISGVMGVCYNAYRIAEGIIQSRSILAVILAVITMLLRLIPIAALCISATRMTNTLYLIVNKSKRKDAKILASGFYALDIQLLIQIIQLAATYVLFIVDFN